MFCLLANGKMSPWELGPGSKADLLWSTERRFSLHKGSAATAKMSEHMSPYLVEKH